MTLLLIRTDNTRKLRKLERKSDECFWPDSNVDIAWENTEQQGGNDWTEERRVRQRCSLYCQCLLSLDVYHESLLEPKPKISSFVLETAGILMETGNTRSLTWPGSLQSVMSLRVISDLWSTWLSSLERSVIVSAAVWQCEAVRVMWG